MTTKRERLEAAIAGEIADRTPVALWRHFPVDDQHPESLAKATSIFQKEYDFDFIKVTPASSFCIRDWGVEDEWRGSTEGTRDYVKRAIHDTDEWGKLEVLDPEKGFLGNQLRCLKKLSSEADQEVPIIQTIFSPLAQAKNLAGQNRLLEHLHREAKSVLAGLETITLSTIAFIEAAKDRGIDGIFYAVQHASYHLFDRESYTHFGEAYDRRILEAANDLWLNVLHLHGEAIMFDLADRYPVQVVNWHDRETWPDLEEGKRLTNAAVCGGVQRESLVLGDPDELAAESSEAIKSLSGKGMILGTGCVVPVIAPRANIEAIRSSVDFA